MAQFLTIALRASLVVSKKNIKMDNIPVDLAQSVVEENFDLALYDFVETDHNLHWKLKNSVLEKEIKPFFEALFQLYFKENAATYEGFLKEIGRKRTYESLLEVAAEDVFDHFSLDNKQNWQIHLKKQGKHLEVKYNFFQIFKTERMRMDNFDVTMSFLEASLQKAFSEFELSQALALYVFDNTRK
jgi:hypothetical protein